MPGDRAPEDPLVRLPLPLAQLLRRAHNAKSAPERHNAAFYLWEAALKLLGSTSVACHLHTGLTADASRAAVLQNLARPSLGHWWEIARSLTTALAGHDPAFARLHDLLRGKPRHDLPRVAGLDAALAAVLENRGGGRSTVRVGELFDRLIRYRNQEIGHGAAGQRGAHHYETLAAALLAGVPQLLEKLDVLAGRRLLYLGDVRRLGTGTWLVERYELIGEAPQRLESLERTHAEAAALLPQRVYLADAAAGVDLWPLHPLVGYELESNELLFLNARRGKQRVEYLCYTNGRTLDRVETAAQNALLGQLLALPVDDAQREAWQARSQAEEPALPQEPGGPARTLGEFELRSELGRGGMGVVYRAWQPSLGREVALKELMKTGDAKAEKRFAREIAALGQVEHPHLVRIFTSVADGEHWFYAMELVEGTTLASVCDRLSSSGSSADAVDLATWQQAVSTACAEARRGEKPLSAAETPSPETAPAASAAASGEKRTGRGYVRQVVELVRQAAEAAHALHDKGIVHRDIKPGNIMVCPEGTSATLMDLGLAQVADEVEGRLTRTRQFVGTLRYASPEQVLAVARLDRRSDVYSLGATLWELLTLRPLFGATEAMPTPELMQKIQIEEPARVRRLNPAVPRDLAAVVEKCLQKDPKKRYATAQELAAELAAFLAGRPLQARPVSGARRLWMWARRRPSQAAALVLAVLTLVGMAVGGTLFAWQALEHARKERELRREADAKREDADRQRDRAEGLQGVAEKRAADLKKALGRAAKAEEDARDEAGKAKAERDRTREALANTSVLLAYREWEVGNVRQARELLDNVPTDLRRWEWYYYRRAIQGGYCTLYGHTEGVRGVAFSPDGRRLVSGSRDSTLLLWDTRIGHPIGKPLRGHRAIVTSVCFSSDGTRLASGSKDKTLRLWDARTGQPIGGLLRGHTDLVSCVSFSPDGTRLVSASWDWTLRLWDADTGQPVGKPMRGHSNSVASAAFSPDGILLASGSWDKTIRLWDARSGEPLGEPLSGHESLVTSVSFSPDGTRLVSGDSDGMMRLWDVRTRQRIGVPLRGHSQGINSVSFSPDGLRLVSCSMDKTIRLWDASTGQPLGDPLRGHTDEVTSVFFSPDGARLASSSDDSTLRLWDARTGQASAESLRGHSRSVMSVAFSPDGSRLVSGSDDKSLRLWDARTGQPIGEPLSGHADYVTSVSFSPDGTRLVSGSGDKTLRLWDARTGQPLGEPLRGHEKGVWSVSFSPDGTRLVSGSGDKTLRLWDVRTGQPLGEPLRGHEDGVASVSFSPDGLRLVSGSGDKTLRLWDVRTGQPIGEPLRGHESGVTSVSFSPDGSRLASSSWDKTVRLWDARSGQPLGFPLRGHTDNVRCLSFSSDGLRLVSGSDDRTLRLWDAHKGQPIGVPLRGHTSFVQSVAFSADGTRLASGDGSSALRLWDARKRSTIEQLLRGASTVFDVSFSPDGNRLASGSRDGTVRQWDVRTGQRIGVPLRGHTDAIKFVSFSHNGSILWSLDFRGTVKAWDVRTGREIEIRDIVNPADHPRPFTSEWARHPSRPLLALLDDNDILLVELLPPDADERAFREGKARFDPFWHEEQAIEAEKKSAWFAAAFHRGQLAEHAPWKADTWKKLEEDCGKLGRLAPPLAVCDRLLRRDPTLAPIYLRRALVHLHEHDFAGAGADLVRGIHFSYLDHPDWVEFADAEARQAQNAAQAGKWPQAVGHYTLASAWKPHDASYREDFGAALYRAGKYQEAVEQLNEAVRLHGKGGTIWQNLFLAMAYHHLGKADDARKHLARARLDDKANWQHRLIYQYLRNEAEMLLRTPARK